MKDFALARHASPCVSISITVPIKLLTSVFAAINLRHHAHAHYSIRDTDPSHSVVSGFCQFSGTLDVLSHWSEGLPDVIPVRAFR